MYRLQLGGYLLEFAVGEIKSQLRLKTDLFFIGAVNEKALNGVLFNLFYSISLYLLCFVNLKIFELYIYSIYSKILT